MSAATLLATKWPLLTEQQQLQVLELIERLAPTTEVSPPLVDLYGLFAGYNTTEEDIAEARKELWGNFPREDF
jgi:hypothetical protein